MTPAIDKATARLPAENFTVYLRPAEDAAPHEIVVSIARHPATNEIHEIAFVTRGKIGHGLDLMLQDFGIQLSRAIQNRDPETGTELDTKAVDEVGT